MPQPAKTCENCGSFDPSDSSCHLDPTTLPKLRPAIDWCEKWVPIPG